MRKFFTTTGMYSLFFSGMLVIAVFCAGCSDEVTPSAQVQMPGTTGSQVKFAEGDIIAKSATSTDLYFVILGYDPVTDQYERAFVEKKTDGTWVRSSDKAEFADRDLVEKIYPARVGHVSQVSQISIETPPENVPLVISNSGNSPSTCTIRSHKKAGICANPDASDRSCCGQLDIYHFF